MKLLLLAIAIALLSRIDYIPSIPFVITLAMRCLKRDSVLECGARAPLWIAFSLTGLLLYPTALGLTDLDIYSLGYSNPWFIASLAAIATLLLCRDHPGGLLLAATLLAAALKLHPSPNLWDYLIDPVFFLYCVAQLFRRNQPRPDSTAKCPALT